MPDTCVIGLGKLGLPVAVHIAQMGNTVRGADINESTVQLVNDGVEPFPGEPELPARLAEVHRAGLLTATTNIREAVAASEAVVVLVPLLVDANRLPDFTALDAATIEIGKGLTAGTLVSYETTLPVGTTRSRFAPQLESLSSYVVGSELFVAHSPERVFTGRVFQDLRRYPKLVGGVTNACRDRATSFYSDVLEFDDRPDLARPNGVWPMATVETAEMAKLAETTYRNVNIGLANEYAQFAEANGIDVYDVIEASNSQVFSHIHQPGASVGGHCIPVYPHLYMSGDVEATIPRASVAANERMPQHMVHLLRQVLGDLEGVHVAVLGLAFRSGVKEDAFSGTYGVLGELERQGATGLVHDPMYTNNELLERGFRPYRGEQVTGAILHTAHGDYDSWTPANLPGLRAMIDGRNTLRLSAWPGVVLRTLGRSSLSGNGA